MQKLVILQLKCRENRIDTKLDMQPAKTDQNSKTAGSSGPSDSLPLQTVFGEETTSDNWIHQQEQKLGKDHVA